MYIHIKQLDFGNDTMKSMTGFGRGELRNDLYECIVRDKTINHRYKDFTFECPGNLIA